MPKTGPDRNHWTLAGALPRIEEKNVNNYELAQLNTFHQLQNKNLNQTHHENNGKSESSLLRHIMRTIWCRFG